MKTRTILTAAALLGLGALMGAASAQPSQAQQGAPTPPPWYGGSGPQAGEWQAAGAYYTEPGGEVWMINTRTGAARNCYWVVPYQGATSNEMRCREVS